MTVEQYAEHQARVSGVKIRTCPIADALNNATVVPCHTAAELSAMDQINRHQPVVMDGERYDSTIEYKRHLFLKTMELAQEIVCVLHHPPAIDLMVNGRKVGRWEPDFEYVNATTGMRVLEDVKGYTARRKKNKAGKTVTQSNPAYRLFTLKARIVEAMYPDCRVSVVTKANAEI